MTTVKDLLQTKEQEVWSIKPEASVAEALAIMAEKKIGAILVVSAGNIQGIFSERDYARQVATSETLSLEMSVSELMKHPVYYACLDQTIEDCMAIMTSRRFRHLPVLDGNRLVGIISVGDVVKRILAEKDTTIQGLEHFISGTEPRL